MADAPKPNPLDALRLQTEALRQGAAGASAPTTKPAEPSPLAKQIAEFARRSTGVDGNVIELTDASGTAVVYNQRIDNLSADQAAQKVQSLLDQFATDPKFADSKDGGQAPTLRILNSNRTPLQFEGERGLSHAKITELGKKAEEAEKAKTAKPERPDANYGHEGHNRQPVVAAPPPKAERPDANYGHEGHNQPPKVAAPAPKAERPDANYGHEGHNQPPKVAVPAPKAERPDANYGHEGHNRPPVVAAPPPKAEHPPAAVAKSAPPPAAPPPKKPAPAAVHKAPAAPAAKGEHDPTIPYVERFLTALGDDNRHHGQQPDALPVGPIDGLRDAKFIEAVKKFQKSEGLPETGNHHDKGTVLAIQHRLQAMHVNLGPEGANGKYTGTTLRGMLTFDNVTHFDNEQASTFFNKASAPAGTPDPDPMGTFIRERGLDKADPATPGGANLDALKKAAGQLGDNLQSGAAALRGVAEQRLEELRQGADAAAGQARKLLGPKQE